MEAPKTAVVTCWNCHRTQTQVMVDSLEDEQGNALVEVYECPTCHAETEIIVE